MVVIVGVEGVHNGCGKAGELAVGEVASFNSVETSGVNFCQDGFDLVFMGGGEVPKFFELAKGFVKSGTNGGILEISLGAEVAAEVPKIVDSSDIGIHLDPRGVR